MSCARPRRRVVGRATVALLGSAAVLVLANCGSPPPAPIAPPATGPIVVTPSVTPTTSATKAGPVSVLTGLPVAASVESRAAVAVPLAVSPDASDLSGAGEADLVFEEFAEPDRLHLLAFFHSTDPQRVGPVDEARPVDTRLLGPLRALYVFDTATTGIRDQIRSAKIISLDSGSGLLRSDPAQSARWDRYVATSSARRAGRGTSAPPSTFLFDAALPETGRPAGTVTITAPGHDPQTWTFRSGRWGATVGGAAIQVSNLLIVQVPYKALDLKHPARTIQVAQLGGRGEAVSLVGPVQVPGIWSKPNIRSVLNVADASGAPVQLLPGRSWVLLVPTTGKVAVR